jgi:hypothetical protein
MLVAALAVVASGGVVRGHHSITGQYDLSQTMTLTGVISKVDWINPHAYVHLDVTETNGTATWALSTVPLAMMRKAGLTREALRGTPGDVVTIDIFPGWDASKRLGWILQITYPDGRFYRLSGQ